MADVPDSLCIRHFGRIRSGKRWELDGEGVGGVAPDDSLDPGERRRVEGRR